MSEPFFGFVFDLLEEGDHLLLEVALPGVLETEIDGDLIVTVQIKTPRHLSEEERRQFETMRATGTMS